MTHPTRRSVLRGIAASALAASAPMRILAAPWHQADTTWFANSSFGISTHWTAQSQPVGEDDWLPFEEAVANFNVQRYVDQAANAGARYVLFTSCHALQMLPAPCAAIDAIAPRRTTRRDLLGDLADACHARGLHFLLYYNHSCNRGDDPAWEYAVGYHAANKQRFVHNLFSILRELGSRYGSRVQAWWFDSCGSLDPRGIYNGVSTDLHGFQFPWDQMAEVARTGNKDRLVTFSSGMLTHFLYSRRQDYEWGEANDLIAPATSRFDTDHLQGHRWVCLDNPAWVHSSVATPLAKPRFAAGHVADYVKTCNQVQVPVTFNIDIDRTSLISPDSLALLANVKKKLA